MSFKRVFVSSREIFMQYNEETTHLVRFYDRRQSGMKPLRLDTSRTWQYVDQRANVNALDNMIDESRSLVRSGKPALRQARLELLVEAAETIERYSQEHSLDFVLAGVRESLIFELAEYGECGVGRASFVTSVVERCVLCTTKRSCSGWCCDSLGYGLLGPQLQLLAAQTLQLLKKNSHHETQSTPFHRQLTAESRVDWSWDSCKTS